MCSHPPIALSEGARQESQQKSVCTDAHQLCHVSVCYCHLAATHITENKLLFASLLLQLLNHILLSSFISNLLFNSRSNPPHLSQVGVTFQEL